MWPIPLARKKTKVSVYHSRNVGDSMGNLALDVPAPLPGAPNKEQQAVVNRKRISPIRVYEVCKQKDHGFYRLAERGN